MGVVIGVVAGASFESFLNRQMNSVSTEYCESVAACGGVPIIIPLNVNDADLEAYLQLCDGFVFTGGIDINPLNYGEDPHDKLGETNLKVDEFQLTLIKKVVAAKKPLLGICRGHQLLNVACGGTLYQDLSEDENCFAKHWQAERPRWSGSHQVTIAKDSQLYDIFGDQALTNSFHHQTVKDLGAGLKITAWTNDNTVESIEVAGHPFQVGVQWHPEMCFGHSDQMLQIFQKLVSSCQPLK